MSRPTIVMGFVLASIPVIWQASSRITHWRELRAAARSEIRYYVYSNIDFAGSAISRHEWGEAQLGINRARLAAGSDPTLFNATDLQLLRDRIDQTQSELLRVASRFPDAERAFNHAGIMCRYTGQITDLLANAERLRAEARYEDALQVVDQIQILDPGNDRADELRGELVRELDLEFAPDQQTASFPQ